MRSRKLEYQQLFALAPNSERVHQLLAESLQAQDKPSEAEAEYKAALSRESKICRGFNRAWRNETIAIAIC